MKNWIDLTLNPSDSMSQAIVILNDKAQRIALVIDEDCKLLGTITDGDIRRALIRELPMSIEVRKIMQSTPTFCYQSDSKNLVLSKMKKLSLYQIPIVNSENKIVDIETIQHILEDKVYENPVFIMAGGFGKRLLPLTEKKPKPLLNVGDRPILETIIEQFANQGFNKIYISTHYKAEMIRGHFGNGENWNIDIEYLHEEIPLGTAGSLGLLPKNLPEIPVIMMNGDLLTKVNFESLLEFHNSHTGSITMCVREYDSQIPYGVVDIKGQHVLSIQEKPVQKFFVNAGIYVLNPKIIGNINGISYLDMPDLLKSKIKKGDKINVFPIHEYWLDIGQMDEYEQAHKYYNKEF